MQLSIGCFEKIPDDALVEIMKFSSIQTLGRLESVCKRFRKITSERGWKQIYFRDYIGDLPYAEARISPKRQVALLTITKKNIKAGYFLFSHTFPDMKNQSDYIGTTLGGHIFRRMVSQSQNVAKADFSIYHTKQHAYSKLNLPRNWEESCLVIPLKDDIYAISDNTNLYLWDSQNENYEVFQDVKMKLLYVPPDNFRLGIPGCLLLEDGSFVFVSTQDIKVKFPDLSDGAIQKREVLTIVDYKTKKILFQDLTDISVKNLSQVQVLDENTLYVSYRRMEDPYGAIGLILKKELDKHGTFLWKIDQKFDLTNTVQYILPSKD